MIRYIHYFDTLDEFNQARKNNYSEPWVSYTVGDGVNYNKSQKEKLTELPLTFDMLAGGVIKLVDDEGVPVTESYHRPLKYKVNDGQWTLYDDDAGIAVYSGDTVQFKSSYFILNESDTGGNGVSFFSLTEADSPYIGEVNIRGNIMSLVDENNFATLTEFPIPEIVDSYYDCQSIFTRLNPVDAGDLILPATEFNNYSPYSYMFYNCAFLTRAPELPATTLSDGAYSGMFSNCISLTTAPELPATTLGEACYMYMFRDCTSLTKAPELPATTLTNSCYYGMLWGCTSLTMAPNLPATVLDEECYFMMFADCTSLTACPELPAEALATGCYHNMFAGCTGLTTPPVLSATTFLGSNCYAGMFSGCTSLIEAPELPATSLTLSCYNKMFADCTSLTAAPVLPATTLSRYCYAGMFSGCTNLNYIKCMAITKPDTTSLNSWVSGVSSNGTFVKNQSASSGFWSTGDSGIPNNWTIQTA